VLYRFGPNREHARWRLVSIGSAAAVAAWLAISALFSWYLSNFANYSAVYGSLGAIIGLMMWMWLSAMAILVGAEVDAIIARREAQSGEH
jgi:membrane protein